MLSRVLPLLKKSLQLVSNPNFRQLILTAVGVNVIYDFSPVMHCFIFTACIIAGVIGDQLIESRRFKPSTISPEALGNLSSEALSKLNYFKTHISHMEKIEIPLSLTLQFCSDFLSFYQLGYYFIMPRLTWLYPTFSFPLLAISIAAISFISMKYRAEATEQSYSEYRHLLSLTPKYIQAKNPTNPIVNFCFIAAFITTQICLMHTLSAGISVYVSLVIKSLLSPYIFAPIIIIGTTTCYLGAYDYFKNAIMSLMFGHGMMSTLTILSTNLINHGLKHLNKPAMPTGPVAAVKTLCMGVTFVYSLNNFQERNRQNIIASLIRKEDASSNARL